LVPSGRSRWSTGGFSLLAVFTETLQRLIADNGYLAVFLLMLLGSICIPIPSEVVMAFAGALCAPDFAASVLGTPDPLSLGWVVAWGVAGSLIGSWLAYALGAWGGRPAIDRWGRYLLLRPHEVDRAHDWFERRGEAVVFLGRLVPLIRAFVSLPAGVARMNLRKFTAFTLLGVIPWCLGLAYAGKTLGARWHSIEKYFAPLALIAGIGLLAGLVWLIGRRGGAVPVAEGGTDGRANDPDRGSEGGAQH
jgi:membrane protein DedA with SNARE-associated domain